MRHGGRLVLWVLGLLVAAPSRADPETTAVSDVLAQYQNCLSALKDMQWNVCTEGTCVKKMDVYDGSLTFDPKKISVSVGQLEVTNDKVVAPIIFTFPQDMLFTINYKIDKQFGKKTGSAKVKIGWYTVIVKAKLPKDKQAMQQATDAKKCVNKILPKDITTANQGLFDVFEVDYKPKISGALSTSKPSIIKKIKKHKIDLMFTVQATLVRHVVQKVGDVVFSCLEKKTQDKWALPLKSATCPKKTCANR